MKLFVLQYSVDDGSRESYNVFYTPVEVFSSEELRDQRIEELKKEDEEYDFIKTEMFLDNSGDDDVE